MYNFKTDKMENYTQLCVWPGTELGDSNVKELENFFKKEFGVRVKYKCEVKTLPDMENGKPVLGTGGRNDLFFYVCKDDIMKFAVPKIKIGAKWWEDMIKYNDNTHLYTKEFLKDNPPTW